MIKKPGIKTSLFTGAILAAVMLFVLAMENFFVLNQGAAHNLKNLARNFELAVAQFQV